MTLSVLRLFRRGVPARPVVLLRIPLALAVYMMALQWRPGGDLLIIVA